MFMLGLNETTDQLAMANSVHLYGHLLWREDGHVLRGALDFEVEGQREAEEDMDEEESMKVGLRMEDALLFKVECQHKLDYCWVEVNAASLTCWGYCQILYIGVSLSLS